MKHAYFRFYEELNDFLPAEKKKTTFAHFFKDRASIKDMIEAIGVPHTEVDLILVNGKAVDFSYIVQDNDRISVYPVFESLDISAVTKLRKTSLREAKFILDVHLGKLAHYLRLVGFDTVYRNNFSDEELAKISGEQKRILLTRDRRLLKRSIITHGYCIRETTPKKQLIEVLRRFDLVKSIVPFSRCLDCNSHLQEVAKDEISDQLPPKVKEQFEEFVRCPNCDKIFWPGSHYEKMKDFVQKLTEKLLI
jgi:hypothetical protein